MGLKEAFVAGAKAAVNAAGNVAEVVTYRKVTSVTYTPGTSPSPAAPTETATPVTNLKVIWQTINTTRVDNRNVLLRDREVLIAAGHLGTVVVSEHGEIERPNGEKWRIVNVQEDPASATYRCQVRQ